MLNMKRTFKVTGWFHLSTQQTFIKFLFVMDMALDAGAIRSLRTKPALQRLTGEPEGGYLWRR